ncbi:BsaA family SipW-dependent biofilm matrix protein [Ruminococcus flavefaciens]|uniref:BsaA family SipW-dependent biofilm matrix protein n=1 Tax=Ruminococcus flavefaciens TaxID=1265 RepID=UPI0026EA6F98|nr:BsaA family SipW-dependent biofilm matrix protein [Ruminococcus flavefaciens]
MNNDVSKKKKTSKEKRILIASLCIAAAVMAGSTFAWFSSKDEVTNRLTANADYGVSIAESFTPPANWFPGQKVNKDVYAVNTGSIPAFVNEDVSGVLTYTSETKSSTFDSTKAVKLTEDEVDIIKAGAFLAGAFATDGTRLNNSGNIAEYFNNGPGTDPKTTDDFTPTVAGLYFFRRSIDVNATDQSETFDYAGYYFDGTDYYKLDDIKVNEIPTGTAGDGINDDGILTKCPTVLYVEEKTETVVPTLSYDAANNRLIARYNTGEAADPTSLNGAAVDALALAADHALQNLNTAETNLEAAKAALTNAGSGYNTALATITYYAGAANADTIETGDLATLADAYFSYATQGSATQLSAPLVVANGVLKSKIDAYNSTITSFNNLSKPANYDNVGSLQTAMSNAQTAMENAEDEFNSAKAAYEAAAGYPYTEPITNPDPTDPLYVVWTKDNAYRTAKANYDSAKAAYDTAKAEKDGYDAQVANYTAQLDSLKAAIQADRDALSAAITARNSADPEGAGNTSADYTDALNAYNGALTAYNDALKAYNDAAAAYQAALSNDNDLVIYINLSADVVTSGNATDKWQLLPIPDGDDTVAHFYYTSILQGSETSAKLIDSVELADTVTQDTYKSFDFDLNINLDSAQITYAEDQSTILTDAVAGTAFENRNANLTKPTSLDTPVLWS